MKVNMHARWDFQTRGVGSTGFGVKVFVWVGLVWAYLGEVVRVGGWSITHQPALDNMFGISGSFHKTRSLCTPLGSMFGISGSSHKTCSMCTPWELHYLHIT